jgi:ubiquinone/menaquinone biosynthesis C-methylase UbiE
MDIISLFKLFLKTYRKKYPKASYPKLVLFFIFTRIQQHFMGKRFELFKKLMKPLKKPLKILDIGGTFTYWQILGLTDRPDVRITLLNLVRQKIQSKNVRAIVGDARNLGIFKNKQFDVVYSNSLIEHLPNFKEQATLAKEIGRIGKRYYVQTPNRYFFMEPHFLVPFFYLIPDSMKPMAIRILSPKWWLKTKYNDDYAEWVKSVRLLDKKELEKIFKGGSIHEEKFLFFTKSFVVYK